MKGRPASSAFWGMFAAMLSLTFLVSVVVSSERAFQIFSLFLIEPCVLAIILLHRLEREHEHGTFMWWTWRLMLISSVAELLRHSIAFTSSLYSGSLASNLRSLSQIPTEAGLLLEMASLILMWMSLRSVGMQQPFTRQDWLTILVASCMVIFCVVERKSFPHATSAFYWLRYVELLNPLLFSIGILVATVLYRLSKDLGGGDLALSVLFLALQLAARFVGFALEMLRYRLHRPLLSHPSNAFYWSSAWFILWAILLRGRMTLRAREVIRVSECLRSDALG